MTAMDLLTGPFAQAIGWALLHLLWQASIVAGILAALLAMLPRSNASGRYAVSCGALVVVFVMFVVTAARNWDPSAHSIAAAHRENAQSVDVPLTRVPAVIAAAAAETWRERAFTTLAGARQILPAIVGVWLLGVLLLTVRLLLSWSQARSLAGDGTAEASPEWQRVAVRLSRALGLTRPVRLLESAAVDVPAVLGSFRPVILLPVSALTGLTTEQLEMVLAHELAHIRRHDFLVNLMQAFVETLMFYHPAVWWMSRCVRVERENCCDDLAVAVCGDAARYARALTRLEELRSAAALPVLMAASGGSLLDRIRRIAVRRAESTGISARWAAAIAMLAVVATMVAVPTIPVLARNDDAKQAPSSTSIEVVEPVAETASLDDEDWDVGDEEIDVDVDVDVDTDDLDIEIDIDPLDHIDLDHVDLDDLHLDLSEMAGLPAMPPAPPVPVVRPGMPVPAPAPAPAPRAVIAPHPVPAVAPLPPVPPVAIADFDYDFDFDFESDDDEESSDREQSASGKPSVDDLIALRAVGVDSEYIAAMRRLFEGISFRRLVSLRAVGVTPEYVQQMRAAGLEVDSARAATSLRATGVTPEWMSSIREAGLKIDDAKTAASLRAVGVTAEWIREMRQAGVKVDSARDAISMRAVGVDAKLVRELAEAGYTGLSARELTRLAAQGVDGSFIRDLEKYRNKQKK